MKSKKEEPKIWIKLHRQAGEILLAACDESIAGKVLKSRGISVTINKSFYCGELVRIGTLKRYLMMCTTANLFGKDTVSHAVKLGFITKDGIRKFRFVPHAQIYRM